MAIIVYQCFLFRLIITELWAIVSQVKDFATFLKDQLYEKPQQALNNENNILFHASFAYFRCITVNRKTNYFGTEYISPYLSALVL